MKAKRVLINSLAKAVSDEKSLRFTNGFPSNAEASHIPAIGEQVSSIEVNSFDLDPLKVFLIQEHR